MCLCPMVVRLRKAVSMPQAKRQYLLFDLFESQFVVAAHPDILFDLLILFCRDMDRTIIVMGEAPGKKSCVALVRFDLFPS